MADAGELKARVTLDSSRFNTGVNNAVSKANSLTTSFVGAAKQAAALSGAVTVAATAATGMVFGDAINSAANYEKSMISLEVISERFGVSAEEAKAAAVELGKELRIGTAPAAESLQHLLKNGLNLDEARGLLQRFTNEAITGKSSTISLSHAVENLSFAYATNNSALGNLSGVSENFEDIVNQGREALIAEGVAVEDITDEMAKYRGMIDLTNLTLGASERFQGSYIDNMAILENKIEEAKVALGQKLMPIMNEFLKVLTPLADNLITFVENFDFDAAQADVERFYNDYLKPFVDYVVEHKNAFIAAIAGMAVAFSAFAIIGAVSALFNPLTLSLLAIGAAIAFLAVAWEENWGGIRDTVEQFWKLIKPVWQEMQVLLGEYLVKTLAEVKAAWEESWSKISDSVEEFWEYMEPVTEVIKKVLQESLAETMEEIEAAFAEAWPHIQELIKQSMPIIQAIGIAVGVYLFGMFLFLIGAVNAFIKVLPHLVRVFSGTVQMISGWLDVLVGIFQLDMEKIQKGTEKVFNGLKDFIGGTLKSIGAFFSGFWEVNMKVFGDNLVNGMKEQINSAVDQLNEGINEINKVGDSVQEATGVDVPNIPNIPRLASGTSFAEGGVYDVGENGRERVVLPRGSRVMNASETAASSNKEITINNYFPQQTDVAAYQQRMNFLTNYV